jgi:hypothetical protein
LACHHWLISSGNSFRLGASKAAARFTHDLSRQAVADSLGAAFLIPLRLTL